MKKIISIVLIFFCVNSYAGSAQNEISCTSSSGRTSIKGYVPGDAMDYDLTIKIDKSTLRYVDACSDIHCSKMIKSGLLYAVDDMRQKVFTIAFARKYKTAIHDGGYFYAIPASVKYQRKGIGHIAQFKGIYYGVDPRSNDQPKAYVKYPIELQCKVRRTI